MTADLTEGLSGTGGIEDMATYAVEVLPGCEAEAAGLLGDCAVAPAAEFEYLKGGERVREVRPVLPGLVLLRAADLVGARKACRRARGLADLQVPKSKIEEISPETAETLYTLCGEGGVAAFSEGTVAGGFKVQRGALAGRESLVGRVGSRRKCAYVPVDLAGKHVELELGLRVTRKDGAA